MPSTRPILGASRRHEAALFWIPVALLALPVWCVRYFVTQDGPSHIDNAHLLRSLREFGSWVSLNPFPVPNWMGHAIGVLLLGFTGPVIADKIIITGCVVLLPISLRYAIGALRPENRNLALLSFPLAYNALLYYGFYNFLLGVSGLFLLLGLWWRRGGVAALTVTAVALYFCHLSAVLLAAPIIAADAIRSRRKAAVPALLLPLLLSAALLFLQGGVDYGSLPAPFAARLRALLHFSTALQSYEDFDWMLGGFVAVFYAALVVWVFVRVQIDWLLAFPAALALLYFVAPPSTSGGQYILERLQILLGLAIVFFAGTRVWTKIPAAAACVAACALTGSLIYANGSRNAAVSDLMEEYMSGAALIERRATVLPLHFDSRGGGPLKLLYHYPFRHAAGYVCAARGCFNLDNYEAETALFPLRFRPEADPAAGGLGSIEDEPPRVDIEGFERSTGRRVDYLLVWNAAGDAPETAPAYEQVFLSRANHLRVLRRRN